MSGAALETAALETAALETAALETADTLPLPGAAWRPAGRTGPPTPHRSVAVITGWCRPLTAEDGSPAGVQVNGVHFRDAQGRLAKFTGRRVTLRGWLHAESTRHFRVLTSNVRPARPNEPNDVRFSVIGVLIRHLPNEQVLRVEVCPQGDTTPFGVTVHATGAALRSVSSDSYAVHAEGGLIAGLLVVDTLTAVYAPVPARWTGYRQNRRARNHQRKQEQAERQRQARARKAQARSEQPRTENAVAAAKTPLKTGGLPQRLERFRQAVRRLVRALARTALDEPAPHRSPAATRPEQEPRT